MLTALKFDLASGASYEYTTPSQEGVPWQVAFYKEGYAIVGFFGVVTDSNPATFYFKARGVFNLGA